VNQNNFFALNMDILYLDEITTDIPRVTLIETMQRGLFIFPYSLSHNGSVFTVHYMVRLDTKL
jgi:hypothetical protein